MAADCVAVEVLNTETCPTLLCEAHEQLRPPLAAEIVLPKKKEELVRLLRKWDSDPTPAELLRFGYLRRGAPLAHVRPLDEAWLDTEQRALFSAVGAYRCVAVVGLPGTGKV